MKRFILAAVLVFVCTASPSAQTDMKEGTIPQHECKAACAAPWLKKAIDLYDSHLKNPGTMTPASQEELRENLQKAYDCLTKNLITKEGGRSDPQKILCNGGEKQGEV